MAVAPGDVGRLAAACRGAGVGGEAGTGAAAAQVHGDADTCAAAAALTVAGGGVGGGQQGDVAIGFEVSHVVAADVAALDGDAGGVAVTGGADADVTAGGDVGACGGAGGGGGGAVVCAAANGEGGVEAAQGAGVLADGINGVFGA
ncbi:hypothetical protein ADT32_07325 [Xylella fastidiosa]|nr:hypothetical protein BCV75_11110 [Xylella fastidiosa]AVI23639.1 hypothetical protein BC375_11170 [Xylella fastidiosa]KXB10586.1 hypothetical protein ADT32_07325 [Xylella fastidiosa]KXB13646.1 hypothetical protein ADT33_08085 [Xylella fastidiosa]